MLFGLQGIGSARVLTVGPGKEFDRPSRAARAAQDGDTILIAPGEYYDCTIWKRNHLIIAGDGEGAVITDTTCQGKALFVIQGNDTTIRDLTLTRARVADGNGAGIRLEGQGLTVENVQFINNQVGLLSGIGGPGEIHIRDSTFARGGGGGDRPLFAVWVWGMALLRIEDSTFEDIKGGQINSGAKQTALIGNKISTGTGPEPAVAVMAHDSDLVIRDNLFTIGPNAPRRDAAVLAMGSGKVVLERNRLVNETGQAAAMLLNWTGTSPVKDGNSVAHGDAVVSTDGLWRHRLSGAYHQTKDGIHDAARWLKQRLVP